MNKEVLLFTNLKLGLKVRAVKINGEAWLVGKDVAGALGYSRANHAINRHCDEDDVSKQYITDSLGRSQETLVINESGLYSLVLRSKLPSAKKFRRWVTNEVLPQIRKTGGYIPVQKGESEANILAKALIIAQKRIELKDKELAKKRK